MTKNVFDARYEKTEAAIFDGLVKIITKNPRAISIRPSELAKKSGISASTFYRHYKTVDDILNKYEKRLLKKYRARFNYQKLKASTPKQTFHQVLFFIFSNRKIFTAYLGRGDHRLLYLMLSELKPKIYTAYNFPKNSAQIFDILFYEIYSLIEKWNQNGFTSVDLDRILSNIIHLVETSRQRLIKIT